MKKTISVFLIFILCISAVLTGCGAKQKNVQASGTNSLNGIKDKGKFVIGLDDSFPPMGFRDEKGDIVGFDIDLAKEAAKRMGVQVEFKPVDWDGVILSLNTKKIDVIWNGLTITEDRKKQIAFTKPYLEVGQSIVVNSNSTIKTKADLAGKVVGLQQGSSSEEALKSDTKTAGSLKDIKKYSNNTEALMDLASGRIDAVVVDEMFGGYYMTKKPGQYKMLDENFGTQIIGVGLRKEDADFLKELDKTLDAMKSDGKAAEISKKWFGKDIVSK